MKEVEGKSSEDIAKEVATNLKEQNTLKYITPSDINELGSVKKPEEVSKIKRVLNLLIFMKVLKFNRELMLWENCFYKKEEKK